MDLKFWNKINKKSATTSPDYPTFGTGCYYMQTQTDVSPANLLLQNKGFVFACSNKLAGYTSSIPIHLYAYTGNKTKLYTPHKSIPNYLSKSFKQNNRISKKALEMVEIEESPLLDLLMKPSKHMSYNDWMSFIVMYLSIMGNCLLEIVKDGETIIALEPLLWEKITPYYATNGTILSYTYQEYSLVRTFTPEQVIHLRNYQPGSLVIGRGNLEAAIESAALYSYYDAYATQLSRNYAMPGIALNVPFKPSNKDEAEKIAQEFINKFSRSNVGKPIVTFGDGIKLDKLGISPNDMEYEVGRKWALKVIASCFGIPEDLVTTENSNRASSLTAMSSFYNITVLPLLERILEQINTNVVALVDDNAWYWYDSTEVLNKDPEAQSKVILSYVSAGILTVEEAREKLGFTEAK